MEIKLGLTDFTFFLTRRRGMQTDVDLMRKAAEWGLQCVQIGLGRPEQAEHREALRAEAESLSLAIAGQSGGVPSVEAFEHEIRAAKELGCEVVRHASGPFRLMKRPVPPKEMAEALSAVAAQAEGENVTIAIENHQDYTAEELASIMGDVDSSHIGVCLDTGNSIALLEDPMHTAETLARYTKTVHLKDYLVMPAEHGVDLVGTALGTGAIENAPIIELLRGQAPVETLYINIENPLERCPVPIMTREFADEFGERRLADLAPVLALVEKSKELHADPVRLPQERGLLDVEIAAVEDESNRAAVAYCRDVLGLQSSPADTAS